MVWSMSAACVLTLVTGTRPSASCTISRTAATWRSGSPSVRSAYVISRSSGEGICAYGTYTTGGIWRLSPPYRAVAATPTIWQTTGASPTLMLPPISMCRPTGSASPKLVLANRSLTTATGRRSLAIAFGDLPPPQHRNLHGREEPRARIQDARVLRAARR